MIGPQEMILIFLVVLLLFGASKLPELARSMGKSMGEFKRAQHETELEVQKLGAPLSGRQKAYRRVSRSLRKNLGFIRKERMRVSSLRRLKQV